MPEKKQKKKPKEPKTLLGHIREWFEVIIIAFILAMFIRSFVVELFKVPTGSMTPALIGGLVADIDYDDDGDEDLVVYCPEARCFQVFFKQGDYYKGNTILRSLPADKRIDFETRKRRESDLILVNKFAYWFKLPARGDIVVFKVPDRRQLWDPQKPIFIKRVVGLPKERLTIADNRLYVNGKSVDSPTIFEYLTYKNSSLSTTFYFYPTQVPENEIFVFGDNSDNSYDSRAWGGVPLENIRGKAFFRYFPLKKISFLR